MPPTHPSKNMDRAKSLDEAKNLDKSALENANKSRYRFESDTRPFRA